MTQETEETECEAASPAFAEAVVKRAPVFDALLDGPKTAVELESALNLSRSTIHRTTQSFCEEGLLVKRDRTFELTGLGEMTARRVGAFRTSVEAARRLEPLLNTIPQGEVDVPVECFADATVILPRPRQPHAGVKRITELIEESESLRLFTSIISPVYVDVAHREMLDGTDIQAIFDAELVDIIVEEYHGKAVEAFESGRFDILLCEDVPFELFLFDARMGMAAHDENGIPRAFVESDDPGAIAWAEDLYEQYRRRAECAPF
jgi:predicted transcriptional regulator